LVLKEFMQCRFEMIFGRKVDTERVNKLLVFVKLEMEMGTGGATRGADVTDGLPFGDYGAGLDAFGEPVEMGVAAEKVGVMFDIDCFAVTAVPASFRDNPVTDRSDGCAPLSGKINSKMW
jgi:hypothetical protein